MTGEFTELPSPCYLLEAARLNKNLALIGRVQRESGCNIILALKGFAMWSAFPLIRPWLGGCAASSYNEARLARERFGGHVHLYAPAYAEGEFDDLLGLCDRISFNSLSQWERFGARALAAGRSSGLRVNPGIDEVETALYNPSSPQSRLGVPPEELAQGLPEGIWEQIASEVSGLDLSRFFAQTIRSTEELDLASALQRFGIQYRLRPASNSKDRGGRLSQAAPESPKSWLGARWAERNGKSVAQFVELGGPAQRAGLASGDELVALNHQKVSADGLEAELKRTAPGSIQLSVFREDQLLHLDVVTTEPPLDTWELGLDPELDKQNPTAVTYRRAWLSE